MALNIQRDRWYRTRGGDKVRVICVDGPGDDPIVVLTAGGGAYTTRATGQVFIHDQHLDDLIAEVRDPTVTPKEWTLLVDVHGQLRGWRTSAGDAVDGLVFGRLMPIRVREVLDED